MFVEGLNFCQCFVINTLHYRDWGGTLKLHHDKPFKCANKTEFWSKRKPTWWQELEEGIIILINSTNNWCMVEETRRFVQLDYTVWLSILHHASWRIIVFKFPWGMLLFGFIGLLLLSVLLVSLLSCPLHPHDNNNNYYYLFYIVPQQ